MFRWKAGEPVDVVVNTDAESTAPGGPATFDSWKTSRGNVAALARCARGVGASRVHKDVRVRMSRESASFDDDLIILGGNGENRRAAAFIRFLKHNCPEAGFDYDDRDESRNVIAAGGERVEYDWRTNCRDAPNGPTHDYAVVVLWANPFSAARRRALLCAGFTSIGTASAATLAFGDALRVARRELRPNALRRLLGRRRPCFVALYHLDVEGDTLVRFDCLKCVELPDRKPPEIRNPALVEVSLEPPELGRRDSAAVLDLLVEAFGPAAVADETGPWTQRAPYRRVVARDGRRIVGHLGLVRLRERPAVVGLSDLVVAPSRRGLGLGRRLIEAGVREADADVLIVASDAPQVVRVLDERGFERADERFYYERNGAAQVNDDWWWLRRDGVDLDAPLALPGDF